MSNVKSLLYTQPTPMLSNIRSESSMIMYVQYVFMYIHDINHYFPSVFLNVTFLCQLLLNLQERKGQKFICNSIFSHKINRSNSILAIADESCSQQ